MSSHPNRSQTYTPESSVASMDEFTRVDRPNAKRKRIVKPMGRRIKAEVPAQAPAPEVEVEMQAAVMPPLEDLIHPQELHVGQDLDRDLEAAMAAAAEAAAAAAPDQAPVAEPRDKDLGVFVQDPADPITDPDFCLWHYAQSQTQARDNDRWKRIITLHKENEHAMDAHAFVRLMQKGYNEVLRDFLMAPDPKTGIPVRTRGPPWPAARILNPRIIMPSSIYANIVETQKQVLETLICNGIFVRRPGAPNREIEFKSLEWFNKTVVCFEKAVKQFNANRDVSLYGRGSA